MMFGWSGGGTWCLRVVILKVLSPELQLQGRVKPGLWKHEFSVESRILATNGVILTFEYPERFLGR